MPNLVGLWKPEAAPEEIRQANQSQTDSIRSGHLRFHEYRMSGPGWAAALLDHGLLGNGEQPGISPRGRWRVLLDGEVFNFHELEAARGSSGGAGLNQVARCAALIEHGGLSVVEEFNGMFALVIWDDLERRLHLVVDRHGARPLFLHRSRHGLVFGTELKGLLASGEFAPSIDPVAIYEQLTFGVHFRGRTWIAGCERLQPATIVTMQEGGVSQRCYWKYAYRYPARQLTQEAYATRFAVLLDRAVENCMRGTGRIGMFLSGGYDSRSVAASIRPHHLPIHAFTFGEPDSRDMRIAPVLAARLGLKHVPLPPAGPYLRANAEAIVWRTEGLLPFANSTSIRFHDQMTRHVDIFLTGFLGEFSGSHTWPSLMMARTRSAIVTAIHDRCVAPRTDRARAVLRPEVFARAEEEARQRFIQSFGDIENDHPMDVADAWNFTCLQPGGTFQAPAVDRHRLEMRAPHLDRDLVDFLMTIPPSARIEQRVYKRMIAHAFPAVRDIPCANSMRPIEPLFWKEYPLMVARKIGRRISQPLGRLLGREDRLGRELSDLDADIRAEHGLLTEILKPAISRQWLDDGVFSVRAIDELAEQHYSSQANHGALLAQLMTMALASRIFLQKDPRDVPQALRSQEHL